MSKFRIRLVYRPGQSNTDILAIVRKLDKTIFPKDEPYGWYVNYYWWLAYNAKGEVVGFSGLDPQRLVNGYLCRCGVLRRWRGNGLQKRFLRVREQYAKKLGMARVLTYTSLDNFGSINSLTKAGYKIYRPKEYDKNWLYYRKDF